MCTLMLFKRPNGFRIFMNRDERHDRAAELPPRVISSTNNIFAPLDPLSGGTWIATNKEGYWGCLLNGYFEQEVEGTASRIYTSRGEILPMLLAKENPITAAQQFNAENYLSFRLLVGNSDRFVLNQWDGKTYTEIDFHANYEDKAFLLSSSSWDQDRVIEIRKSQFKQWLQNNPEVPVEVPSFHLSSQPTPETAPMMLRSYSGTKSITTLDVFNHQAYMRYQKIDANLVFTADERRAWA